MRPGGGKKKGNSYEGRIAKILGGWWWGKPFRRVPASGGWDKLSTDGEVVVAGDIYAPKEANWPYCVECKKQEKWSMEAIVNGSCELFTSWLDQCIEEAKRVDLIPLLVFSRNRKPDFVAYSRSGEQIKSPDIHVSVRRGEEYFYILTLKDFMSIMKTPCNVT